MCENMAYTSRITHYASRNYMVYLMAIVIYFYSFLNCKSLVNFCLLYFIL